MRITIVLADDHSIVRRGMRALLEAEPGFLILGVAENGLEAVRLARELKPDVLLLDLMMPGLSGLEALRIVRHVAPRTRIVILSMHSTTAFIAEALQNGATGYVLKGGAEEDLVRAVRAAAAGKRFLSSPVTESALQEYIDRAESGSFDAHNTLTPRQREVLQLSAEGKTAAEVAVRLNISQRTVEHHRASLMKSLGLHTQSDMIRRAIRYGLLTPDI